MSMEDFDGTKERMGLRESDVTECSLCGAEIAEQGFPNNRGEVFCSKYHRERSNKMLSDFLGASNE